ncbi:hypothetical protein [Polaribacter septentrionalilitoris]|uniref:hypothetical protein n=1 Tax=Polaribacter septentrionalilitoris TaxID=2494657 RepID=UPI001357C58E|nr:hypothetical protein [Polaribacter septentrionalilitoris]
MKSLDLKQMEKVQGGGNALMACAGGAAVAAISVAATILTGGMFGFAAVLGMSFAAASCSVAAGNMPK